MNSIGRVNFKPQRKCSNVMFYEKVDLKDNPSNMQSLMRGTYSLKKQRKV